MAYNVLVLFSCGHEKMMDLDDYPEWLYGELTIEERLSKLEPYRCGDCYMAELERESDGPYFDLLKKPVQ
jgi:predicted ArsR family transcriptional regulator